MPLSNYAELQSAVAAWTNKSNLGSFIPDFIRLAESRINRRLKAFANEAVVSGTISGQIPFPSGFLGVRRLMVDLGGRKVEVKPSGLQEEEHYTSSGLPVYYAVTVGGIDTYPDGTGYPYELTYYQGFDLSSTSTNWLLTNHPNVYLFGTLLEAADFLKDTESLSKYEPRFQQALDEVMAESDSRRYGPGLAIKAR